jgi:hypothetical protein
MTKSMLIAGLLTMMTVSPAYTADLCNDAHMNQMDDMIAKMDDEEKKKEAMMQLEISKEAMQKGDTAGCMAHMELAHKAMGL